MPPEELGFVDSEEKRDAEDLSNLEKIVNGQVEKNEPLEEAQEPIFAPQPLQQSILFSDFPPGPRKEHP